MQFYSHCMAYQTQRKLILKVVRYMVVFGFHPGTTLLERVMSKTRTGVKAYSLSVCLSSIHTLLIISNYS